MLSGILVFADKIIDAGTAEYIKEVIRMTQVAELLLEEGRREGRREGRQEGVQESALRLLRKGLSALKVAELLDLTEKEVLNIKDGILREEH